MLHRSFKPAKCKTALKLASSRLKLMKNKREVQVKQMKRELAQLLQAGQDRSARIRVEHVVREEKTMAAYDLLEIYCELIVARLPVIESQKNCPIDLKEAIASVIFAAPRCADIPELVDIRKHLTAKYGKEFASAAVELRPECGVGRMLIEKLSVKAPDGPTKMKILRVIADEHNIKWEPESSEENETQPREDLLNGPNSFEAASRIHVESPYIPVPSHNVDKHSTKPQETHKQDGRHDDNGKFSNHNSRPSTQSSPSTVTPIPPRTESSSPSTGTGSEGVESRQPFRGGSSMDNQNWSMKFKDAASAAQAAADSAEQASMAARAAVELSSRERSTTRHSTESRESSASESRNEVRRNHATIKLEGKSAKDRRKDTLSEQTDENDREEDLKKLTERFNQLKTKVTASDDAISSTSSINLADRHRKTDSVKNEFSDETNVDLSGKDRMEHKEASIRKQSSNVSSDSHSSSFSDDGDVVWSYNEKKDVNQSASDPFISYGGDKNRDTKETTSFDNYGAAFDDSDADGEEHEIGFGDHHEQKSSPYLHVLASIEEKIGVDSHFTTPKQSSTVFSDGLERSTIHMPQGDLLPVTFDDSESDEEQEEVKETVNNAGSIYDTGYKQNISQNYLGIPVGSTAEQKDIGSSKNLLPSKTTGDSHLQESHMEKSTGIECVKSHSKSSESATTMDAEVSKEISLDNDKELDFGTLTGGFRNKGYIQPPYPRQSIFPKLVTSTPSELQGRESESPLQKSKENERASIKAPTKYFDSSDDDSDVEIPQQTFNSNRQETFKYKASNEANRKSTPVTFFDSDHSDSEQNIRKETASVSKVAASSTKFSRRTKVSEKKSPPKISHARPEPITEAKRATSAPIMESKKSFSQDNSSSTRDGPSKTESLKTLNEKTPSRENSINKASHVHPKLPDFDSITAHMESLRQNRK